MVQKVTRRNFAATAAICVAAIGLLGASAKSADAYQGNMERALSSLYQARSSLREATANKGGHRAKAMDLIAQAIAETQAGIEFANERGGGGVRQWSALPPSSI
jgi:type IV secretory pathway VirB6-like protein